MIRRYFCDRLIMLGLPAISQTNERMFWPPLKKLDLSSNALRYLPMLFFDRWDRLEELHLMHNRWSCDCQNQHLVSPDEIATTFFKKETYAKYQQKVN